MVVLASEDFQIHIVKMWPSSKNGEALLSAVNGYDRDRDKVIKELLEAGTNIEYRDSRGNTAAMIAAEKCDANILLILLQG